METQGCCVLPVWSPGADTGCGTPPWKERGDCGGDLKHSHGPQSKKTTYDFYYFSLKSS